MAISFLNHGATETALTATRAFKTMVDNVAATVRYQSQAAGTAWEGASYQRLIEVLEDIQRQIQTILDESGTANNSISSGQETARSDEREAEQREAERREAELREREAQLAE